MRNSLVTVLTLSLCLVAMPGAAYEKGWQLRVSGTWDDTDVGAADLDPSEDMVSLEGQSGYGLGVVSEYRFSERLGVELGGHWCSNDVDLRVALATGESLTVSDAMEPFTWSLGLDIHVTPNSKTDVYFVPFMAYMDFNNRLTFTVGDDSASATMDDEFGYGVGLGFDYPIGDGGWSFCGSIRYTAADLKVTDEEGDSFTFSHDPIDVGVGFGYRF